MGVKVKDCLLLYEGAKSCEVCKASPQSTTSLLHHGARYGIPFSKDFPHFEVGMKILFAFCSMFVSCSHLVLSFNLACVLWLPYHLRF